MNVLESVVAIRLQTAKIARRAALYGGCRVDAAKDLLYVLYVVLQKPMHVIRLVLPSADAAAGYDTILGCSLGATYMCYLPAFADMNWGNVEELVRLPVI